MAKPAQLPRWANGAGAVTTPEPTEGQKDTGWTISQKPPRQYFNWWMLRVYQWIVYLDGITNEALTWAAKHTFSAGLASSVAPTASTDVANKAYVDGKFPAVSWTNFATSASWTSGGLGKEPAYFKDSTGTVHLKGAYVAAAGAGATLPGTLPAGFQPIASRRFITMRLTGGAPGLGALRLASALVLDGAAPSTGEEIYLDGISFMAEA